jgi:hypothetical protein
LGQDFAEILNLTEQDTFKQSKNTARQTLAQ